MLVDFPLLAIGRTYRVLRGLVDGDGQHLIAGMEPVVLGLEFNAAEQRLALVCQTSVHISHRFFFACSAVDLESELHRLATHFEAIDTHIREPLTQGAALMAAAAEEHRESDPLLARSAYRLAISRYQELEATAPNPATAATARASAERLTARLATLAPPAT